MATVKCASEFRADGEQLAASGELLDFIGALPDGTALSAIVVDKGDQRDPWRVTVGLRATWEEER